MWMAWQAQQQQQQQQQQQLAAEGLDEKDLAARGGLVDVKQQPEAAAETTAAVPGRAEGYKPAASVKGVSLLQSVGRFGRGGGSYISSSPYR